MKIIKYLLLIFFLWACHSQEIKLDVPWYVKQRIKDDGTVDYQYQDSLSKYKKIDPEKTEEKGQIYSYMSNLYYETKTKGKNEILHLVEQSFLTEPNKFCTHLIQPALKYLSPDARPYKRFNMPYIIDLDLDYFLDKCNQCGFLDKNESREETKLHMSYIMLKDQWFRVPMRTANPEVQAQYDAQNRAALDKLNKSKLIDYSQDDIRSDIFVLLLHSTDCDWTKKWLDIYIEKYTWYAKYKDNLNHFLWRSSCVNESISNLVKQKIKNHK